MRINLTTFAEAATAMLAFGTKLPTSRAETLPFSEDRTATQRIYSLLPRAPQPPPPLALPAHVPGQPIPDLCVGASAAPNPVGFAVARYDETLEWLGERRQNATVYGKNPDLGALEPADYRQWVNLPNIGLETHSYLFHIQSHWRCLDDVTVFTQGRIEDSIDNWQGVDELINRTQANPDGMILYRAPGTFNEWWGVWHFGKWKSELDSGVMRKSDRNPGDFWRWMFNGEAPPEQIAWTWSATFAVRREAIKRRPLRFYKRLLHHFEKVNHIKPEEGHFMERFWLSIFKSDAGLQRAPHAHRYMPHDY